MTPAGLLIPVSSSTSDDRVSTGPDRLPAISAFRAASAGDGRLIPDSTAFLLHHPFIFFELMLFTDPRLFWLWWRQFIGMFGWTFIQMSPLHVVMYTAGLILAACTKSARVRISRRQKVIVTVFVLLQGRYFLPLALPAVVIVKRCFQLNGLLLIGILTLVVGVNVFALITISRAYS
jgi:hypothetical protein